MIERLALLALVLLGCGDETEPQLSKCPPLTNDQRMVVTADWLNGTLTLFDFERLINQDCSAQESIVGSVDLTAYPPGPFQLALTPDGTRAVVSVGAGFLPSFLIGGDQVPPGGTLLIVDLASRSVLHEIPGPIAPMGLAIHPDGHTAYVAYYGTIEAPGALFRVVDIDAGTVTAEVPVGGHPEQVALDPAGTLGLVNSDDDNVVRLFQTSSPATTVSPPLFTGGDPGGAAFFDATHALVANSVGLSVAVVDTSVPGMAFVDETLSVNGAPYGVTLVPGTQTLLVTTRFANSAVVVIDASTTPPTIVHEIPLEGRYFPLYAAVDDTGSWAFVAHAEDHVLSVVDLPGRSARSVTWLEALGPTYVAVQP